MKNLLLTLITLISFFTLSQDYPRIEKDSSGKEIVILTLEQAQALDNQVEIGKLLEKAGTDCDSVVTTQISVIDELKRQVVNWELNVSKLKQQLRDASNKTENALIRLENCTRDRDLCEEQKRNFESIEKVYQKELRRSKLRAVGGYIVGGVGVLVGILVVIIK